MHRTRKSEENKKMTEKAYAKAEIHSALKRAVQIWQDLRHPGSRITVRIVLVMCILYCQADYFHPMSLSSVLLVRFASLPRVLFG